MALGHFHHLAQGTQGAGGAVHRVHHHHTRTVPRQHPIQVGRVVVAKRMRRCARRMRALPQRRVRQRVEVDRGLRIGNRLQQTHIGRVAGLADKPVFLADPLGQVFFQCPGGMLAMHKHTGLDHELAVVAQGCHLGADDVGMAGHAEVIVAVEPNGIGTGRSAVKDKLATPLLLPAWREFARNTLLQMRGESRVDNSFCYQLCGGFFEKLSVHGGYLVKKYHH